MLRPVIAIEGPDVLIFQARGMLQDVIDGYLKPMRSHDWDRGALLSMRTMSFASSFPYDSITVPVQIIIGEDDSFLLRTATEVGLRTLCGNFGQRAQCTS